MTLENYDPEKLDQLALRMLDLAADIRSFATRCRREELVEFQLNDKKAQEWLTRLEDWTVKSGADLDHLVWRKKGQSRARPSADSTSSARNKGSQKRAKTDK